MSGLILKFGALQSEPVFEGVRQLMPDCAARFFVVPRLCEQSLAADLFHGELDQVFNGLLSGELVSVHISFDTPSDTKMILVHHPNLGEDNFPYWLVEIEFDRWHDLSCIEVVKALAEMKFATLWFEDTPDFGQWGTLTVEQFPWDDWRLIAAVVAQEGSDITKENVRKGPVYAKWQCSE